MPIFAEIGNDTIFEHESAEKWAPVLAQLRPLFDSDGYALGARPGWGLESPVRR